MRKILLFLFPIFFLIPTISFGAYFYFDGQDSGVVEVGEDFSLEILVNTESKAVNSFTGKVHFDNNLISLKDVYIDGGLIDFWLKNPSTPGSATESEIIFEGIILNPGFNGSDGLVFGATFQAVKEGDTFLYMDDVSILANDGLATNLFSGVLDDKEIKIIPASLTEATSSVATPPVNQGFVTEGIKNFEAKSIKEIAENVLSPNGFDGSIPEIIEDFFDNKGGEEVFRLMSTIGFAASVGTILTSLFSIDPGTLSGIASVPGKISGILFGGLWFRKKKPWGVVYDSVTKQPIDPAYVVLNDENGKEVNTSITDLEGRYGFIVEAGIYSMVANKTNYLFPSKNLLNKEKDEFYDYLYFGEKISINEKGGLINRNIPMDPISFDWNEFAKKDRKLMSHFQKIESLVIKISNLFFYLGFIISIISLYYSPVLYNIVIAGLYVVVLFLRMTGFHMVSHGGVVDLSGRVVPLAIIKVYQFNTGLEVARKISDKNGRYYCLINNGVYYATIQVKLSDGTYSEPKKTDNFIVKNRRLSKVFKV